MSKADTHMKLEERCRKIRLILSDVDGVLTDGGIIFDNQGIETKKYHARDGLGIKLWQRAGFRFGILTARTSHIVRFARQNWDWILSDKVLKTKCRRLRRSSRNRT